MKKNCLSVLLQNPEELRGIDSSGNLNLFARCSLHDYLSHCLLTLLVHGPGIHTSSLGVTASKLQNSLGRRRIFCVIYPFHRWPVMELCITLNEPSQLTSSFSDTGACEGQTMKQKNTSLIGSLVTSSNLYLLWRDISLTRSSLWLSFPFSFFFFSCSGNAWHLST